MGDATHSIEVCPTSAPFFGFMGVSAALCFASKYFINSSVYRMDMYICCLLPYQDLCFILTQDCIFLF